MPGKRIYKMHDTMDAKLIEVGDLIEIRKGIFIEVTSIDIYSGKKISDLLKHEISIQGKVVA